MSGTTTSSSPPRCRAAVWLALLFAGGRSPAAGCTRSPAEPSSSNATVVKIVDGDTIDVRSDDRGRLRIRVIGIDTPEVKQPHYTVGCGGVEASDYAKALLAGQRVAVVTKHPEPRLLSVIDESGACRGQTSISAGPFGPSILNMSPWRVNPHSRIFTGRSGLSCWPGLRR